MKIFRPHDNWKRFNISAERMAMPEIPEEIFIQGLKELIELDKNWVPNSYGCSLYIRPFMFATDEFIGVKPAEKFRFMIITSPAGAYYSKPTRIYLQKEYIRAFPGGIGFTKAAGNYGATMLPSKKIKDMGYDQILWVDGVEHKYVQEIGTMNVFFVIGNTVITPDLTAGTIAMQKQGTDGFGYDPIFIAEGCTKSFAEFAADEKNEISHRKKAFDKFSAYLSEL